MKKLFFLFFGLSILFSAYPKGEALMLDNVVYTANLACIPAEIYEAKDGNWYLKYNNTTSDYYIIYYEYRTDNGDERSSYVEAKPKVSTSVQLGKARGGYRIADCKVL